MKKLFLTNYYSAILHAGLALPGLVVPLAVVPAATRLKHRHPLAKLRNKERDWHRCAYDITQYSAKGETLICQTHAFRCTQLEATLCCAPHRLGFWGSAQRRVGLGVLAVVVRTSGRQGQSIMFSTYFDWMLSNKPVGYKQETLLVGGTWSSISHIRPQIWSDHLAAMRSHNPVDMTSSTVYI